MVDIISHKVIDILPSRDQEKVAEWLSTYPNINIVSRDGSHTYANAISKAFPKAIQVSDRFHIIKNLNEYICEHLNNILPNRIEIPCTRETKKAREVLSTALKDEKIERVKELKKSGKSDVEISRITGIHTRTIKRYLRDPESYSTQRANKHKETTEKIKERSDEAKKLKKEGYNKKQIAKKINMSTSTVERYLRENFNPEHGQYGASRPGKLSKYREKVLLLYAKGKSYREIHEIIKEEGYSGSQAAIRGFVTKTIRINNGVSAAVEVEMVERKYLKKLIYRVGKQDKNISEEQTEKVVDKYPIFKVLYDLVEEFNKILFTKKENKLDEWIVKANNLNIQQLKTFTKGLEKDISAVKNGIKYKYNNGLAEGSVNKIKLVKRIMYGRCSFEMLKCKVLHLERY